MFEQEYTFLRENVQKWLKEFQGYWAVIKGKELIGIFPKYEHATEAAYKILGLTHILITRIEPEPTKPPFWPYRNGAAQCQSSLEILAV